MAASTALLVTTLDGAGVSTGDEDAVLVAICLIGGDGRQWLNQAPN
jgi:hypothetical protein